MIKANELRIGNLLEVSAEAVAVTSIDSDSLCTTSYFDGLMGMNDCLCANANPIPLTEEWLERFGFAAIDELLWTHQEKSIFLCKGDDGFYLSALSGQPNSKNNKYVHQLQNLYFALVGEEIIIEQPA